MEKFSELYEETLKDIYYAEKAILKALPKMAKKACSRKLEAAFTKHFKETQGQVQRLEQVFDLIGKKARGKDCAAIDGIIEEAEEVMKEAEDDTVRDAAELLGATLEEEKLTDAKLTELAESEINVEAEQTDDEEEQERPKRAAGGRRR